jgi:pilus assembly protein CpaF
MEGETITMQEIWRFKMTGRDADGNVLGQFEATGIRPKFMSTLEAHGITLDPSLFRPGAKLGA